VSSAVPPLLEHRPVVGVLQTEPRFGAVEANLDAVERALCDVQADLIVLPELFATGYSFRDRAEACALAEPFEGGRTVERLQTWSRSTGGMIVAGYAERDGDQVFNAAAVVSAGALLGSYRKIHLFGFEREVFDPGDRPFAVYPQGEMRVGVMICFDWMFPESARTLALLGADVIAHPSNLVLPGWCQRAMCIRALENQVFTATANRYGREHRELRPELHFTGASRIAGPSGEVIADAPDEGEAFLSASVDLERARCKQIPSGNRLFLERRPSFYLQREEGGAAEAPQSPIDGGLRD
jgi:predicted amidohydrolase